MTTPSTSEGLFTDAQLSSLVSFLVFFGLTAIASSGCGPALRDSDEFTRKRVREVLFHDACKLQTYYDQAAPEYTQETNVNVSTGGHRTAGVATYVLDPDRQHSVFLDIVARFYKRVPKLDPKETLRVKVPYQIVAGHRQFPINANVVVKSSGEEVTLPYHPCMGAFFFGHQHYEMRRKLLEMD